MTTDQVTALIHTRVWLRLLLDRELEWTPGGRGEPDQGGSAHVPSLWAQIERLTRAFPDPFAELEDPLVRMAEGC